MLPTATRFRRTGRVVATLLLGGLLASAGVVSEGTRASAASVAVIGSHPRLLADDASFSAVAAQRTSDSTSKRLWGNVKASADSQLTSPVIKYEFQDSKRMTTTAKRVVDRVYNLGLAWKLSGDSKYIERLWQDLAAVQSFPNWNPGHFLDTAEIAGAVAIAYDWGYSYWTVARRESLRSALLDKAIRPALAIYEAPEGSPAAQEWRGATHNRNVVNNSGVGLAALAIIGEDASGDAARALDAALASIKFGLSGYLEDGSYPEGPMYWEYGTDYAVTFLNALQTATGSTQGLTDVGGLLASGNFMRDMMTPEGENYSFADSDQRVYPAMSLSGLARLSGDGSLEALAASMTTPRRAAQRLIWRDPAIPPSPASHVNRALFANYPGAGLATMRADGVDAAGAFTALRYGGDPSVGHRHLDAGDFSVSLGGINWAVALGKDEISYLPAADSTSAVSRWAYYRHRPEGHNTVVINPQDPDGYDRSSVGYLERSGEGVGGSFAIANLGTAYPSASTAWKRGVRINSADGQVIVQDELSLKEGVTARWGMHTASKVEILPEGRKAILHQGGKRVLATLDAPTAGRFMIGPAEPFPTSPAPKQESNAGITRLFVAVGGGGATVAVRFDLLAMSGDPVTSPATTVVPLADWSVPVTAPREVKSLRVDGVSVPEFNAGRKTLTLMRDPSLPTPRVEAFDPAGAALPVVQSGEGSSYLAVTSHAGQPRSGVRVTFAATNTAMVSASATKTTRGVPAATIDGDESTGWATTGDASLTLLARAAIDVRTVQLAWSANSTGRTEYDISLQNADGSWRAAAMGVHLGASSWTENQLASSAATRGIRITVHGDPNGDRSSLIRELRVYAFDVDGGTPPGSVAGAWGLTLNGVPPILSTGQVAGTVTASGAAASGTSEIWSSNPSVARGASPSEVLGVSAGTARIGVITKVGAWEFMSNGVDVTVEDPGSVTVQAEADAYVEGGVNASLNFGASGRLDVKPVAASSPADGTRVRHAYMKFDLSQIDPSRVTSATLVTTGQIADSVDVPGTRVDAYRVEAAWTESGVTYVTRPPLGAPVGSLLFTRAQEESRMDVTELVQSLDEAELEALTLGLGGETEQSIPIMSRLNSRESGNGPRIQLTLKPAQLGIATASATGTVRGSAASTFDENLSSGWAAPAGGTVTWKLSEQSLVRSMQLHWSPDASRSIPYKVQVLADGVRWMDVASGAYTGPAGDEIVVFPVARSATQVRLTLQGTGASGWQAVLREATFYSGDPTTEPPSPPPALLKSLEVNGPSVVSLAESARLVVQPKDLLDRPISSLTPTFHSSDAAVISVDGAGTIVGRGVGSATVTVSVAQGPLTASQEVPLVVTDPENVVVAASGDAYVEGGASASINFGTKERLDVKAQSPASPPTGDRVRQAYLKFELGNIAPVAVENAQLRIAGALIETGSATQATIGIYRVDDTGWSENGVTYTNRPAIGARVAEVKVTRVDSEYLVDLTSFIRSRAGSSLGTVAIAIGGSVASNPEALMVRFASRESRDGRGPELRLNIAGGATSIKEVTASSTTRGSAPATIDGNESSGWATRGDQSITWMLTSPTTVSSVRTLWTANTSKILKFELYGRTEAGTWVLLHDGAYEGASGWRDTAFGSQRLTAVQMNVHGAPGGDTESLIREFEVRAASS